MKVAIFSTQFFDHEFMIQKDWSFDHDLSFYDIKLTPETSALAKEHPCISCSVSDQLDRQTLPFLAQYGVRLIALRSAGFSQVDLYEADRLNHVLKDDVLARPLTLPNVIVTAHQAFFTREAVSNIAKTVCH